MAVSLRSSDSGFALSFERLLERKSSSLLEVDESVRLILESIRSRGDEALFEYALSFDSTDFSKCSLRVSSSELASALESLPSEHLSALRLAEGRIRAYHEKLLPIGFDSVDSAGVRLGARWSALDSVGLYVPGGTASYPSSVLMNVVAAQVAGVRRIALVTPAYGGEVSSIILASAALLGIDEVYRVGGAHAIGALAYGTESLPSVDKITGPGNAYVASAKRQVFGSVGIDMIAGPSEVLIVADGANDAKWLAADLLSQAEHDKASQAILITDSGDLAERVSSHIESLLLELPRREIAGSSWHDNGAIIIVDDIMAESVPLIDAIAPEHLQLAVRDSESLMQKVSHAGAIFLGAWTPEAIGDYVAGPNHVLPTSRTARFAEGLGVQDFLKRTSFVECDSESFSRIGVAARTLAELEGLHAHALSLDLRLRSGGVSGGGES